MSLNVEPSRTVISISPGRMVDLRQPELELSDIEQLLWNCSKVNRFGGRGNGVVDVLSHSLHVADRASLLDYESLPQKLAILHDLHESPFGEIPTPAKHAIGISAIKSAVGRFDQALLTAAGLCPAQAGHARLIVKKADIQAMLIEKEWLEIDPGDDWGVGWMPKKAEVDRFNEIVCLPTRSKVQIAMEIINA